jgi:Asp/Glu/hydantoin racemase
MQFYGEAAPELEVINLLDDGLLRLFRSGDEAGAEGRLADMINATRDCYGAELAMLTCSAVPRAIMGRLRASAGLPVLKIDEPMAREAVGVGRRIGVVVTFPPTLETTSRLLHEAAAEAGLSVEVLPEVVPEAYQALLAGDTNRHDGLLLDAIARLRERGPSAIVLAQVSMARVLPQAVGRAVVPVLTSLHSSLTAVRRALEGRKRDGP